MTTTIITNNHIITDEDYNCGNYIALYDNPANTDCIVIKKGNSLDELINGLIEFREKSKLISS